MTAPEFTSEEINMITKLIIYDKGSYYINVRNLVINYVDGFSKWNTMNDKQKKWLLAIKSELSELVKKDY